MDMLNKTLVSNSTNALKANKAKLDANKAVLEDYKQKYQKAIEDGDTKAAEEWAK
jgi:D-serine dehydratase